MHAAMTSSTSEANGRSDGTFGIGEFRCAFAAWNSVPQYGGCPATKA